MVSSSDLASVGIGRCSPRSSPAVSWPSGVMPPCSLLLGAALVSISLRSPALRRAPGKPRPDRAAASTASVSRCPKTLSCCRVHGCIPRVERYFEHYRLDSLDVEVLLFLSILDLISAGGQLIEPLERPQSRSTVASSNSWIFLGREGRAFLGLRINVRTKGRPSPRAAAILHLHDRRHARHDPLAAATDEAALSNRILHLAVRQVTR